MSTLKITNENTLISTIDENISHGIQNGVLHLTSTNSHYDGKTSVINDQKLLNFSSYSYLGLEQHPELKQACVDAVMKYGTQFGFSRAFISIDLYDELEHLLASIFNAEVVVAPSTTLAHQAAMPVMIGDNDVILIDQQAHASMHFSVKNIRDRGIRVELIRHNSIEKIEERIIALRQKYAKIWYICDGVYSMYGDYAPLIELENLMNKYDQFHLYVDDAHGMSWAGTNGRGYVLSQMNLHPQMILVTSLNKAFSGSGGIIVLPHTEWKRKIRTCGGTLIFSTPIQPPMLGVNVASAKLHLTPELDQLQEKLRSRISFCSTKIKALDLPEISESDSPIFYLPTSFPKVSYNLSKRMMKNGFHVTPTLFPAVSMRKAGIRFCVNVNNTESEIEDMLNTMARHYPEAVFEEGIDLSTIYKSFKIKPTLSKDILVPMAKPIQHLRLEISQTIEDIQKSEWDLVLGENGTFDWEGLLMLEKTFQNNPHKEDNWQFYYFIVRNQFNEIVLATFFTKCWCKDDIFKVPEISEDIEIARQADPYYLCTESLMMGSLITEGQHLFLDKGKQNWSKALTLLLDAVNNLQTETKTNAIYLRDFDVHDKELSNLFISNGFVCVNLPDYAHELTHLDWNNTDEFLAPLQTKKRQQIRRDVLKYEDKFEIKARKKVSQQELEHYYELYLNVKKGCYIINTFTLPFKAFQNMNENAGWEMLELKLKDREYLQKDEKLPVAVVFAYRTKQNYIPLLVGLNYDYKYSHKIYKQTVYQVAKRASEIGAEKVYFGITASVEKRRIGATAIPKHVFVQLQDTFNMDVLQMAGVGELCEA